MRYILFLLALSMLIIGCEQQRPLIVEVEFTGSIPIETAENCDKNPKCIAQFSGRIPVKTGNPADEMCYGIIEEGVLVAIECAKNPPIRPF